MIENENEFHSNGVNNQESKNNHGLAILAALMLLIVILFGGYYLMTNLKKPKVEPNPTINEPWSMDDVLVIPEKPEPKAEVQKKEERVVVKSPDMIVEEFYNWYKNHEGNH